ncbi:MAG: hypothetical protein ACRELA_22825 [Candidatus Rokuibacteriota bacterium]
MIVGCEGSGQSGSAFVFLSVVSFSLDGTTGVGAVNSSINDVNASTAVCVTLRNNLKNPTVTTPTSLDNVTIESYTVTLKRLDGGALPGPFTFNTSVLVPAGTVDADTVTGNTVTFLVVVVPASTKRDPVVQPPTRLPLTATADVLFRGRDGRGQRLETTGGVTVVFVSEGESVATCTGTTTT